MKPTKDIKQTYRKILMDSFINDIDKWQYKVKDNFMSKKNKLYFVLYKDFQFVIDDNYFFIDVEVQSLHREDVFTIKLSNSNMRYLYKRMKQHVQNKLNREFNERFAEVIPLTTRRRLKIEKIYDKIV